MLIWTINRLILWKYLSWKKENQTDKPSILPQFKRNKAQENSKLDEKVEEPKTSEKVEKKNFLKLGIVLVIQR